MTNFLESPVQPVSFGEAMQISVKNYYDLLKENASSLEANEFLQLKLAADIVDITDKTNDDKGYEWYSYYNLLNRADLGIESQPLSNDSVQVSTAKFSSIYGEFLGTLSRFVLVNALTPEEKQRKAELEVDLDSVIRDLGTLADADYAAWKQHCVIYNADPADSVTYTIWAKTFGHSDKIAELLDIQTQTLFDIAQILDKKYSTKEDQDIVEAYVAFRQLNMKLCYPIMADYRYLPRIKISLEYLASLYPPVKSGLFDARYVYGFDLDLHTIKTTGTGSFKTSYSKATQDSTTIVKDWGTSVNVSYAFISVKATASEHTAISEDFRKATSILLKSKASFRVGINHGPWFNANLFKASYIKKHPEMFEKFFGKQGSLLYYPSALILVRGFSAEFTSSSQWSYDYNHSFNASVGGGFSIFGINFGASGSYGSDTKEHKIDQTATVLTVADDDTTLRFVGYAVKKNTIITNAMYERFKSLFDKQSHRIITNQNSNGSNHDSLEIENGLLAATKLVS